MTTKSFLAVVIFFCLVAGGVIFGTRVFKKNLNMTNKSINQSPTKNISDNAQLISRNTYREVYIRDIKTALELYFIKHKQYPDMPAALIESGFRVTPDPDGKAYLYAVSKDMKKYHIGALFEIPEEGLRSLKQLNSDADFDSQKAGYTNGFVGSDPVYDFTSP